MGLHFFLFDTTALQGYIGKPQRIQVPAVLQGCAYDYAACVHFGKALRVRVRKDAGGGVRLGLLCFLISGSSVILLQTVAMGARDCRG